MTTKNRRTGRMPPFIPVMRATMSTPAWRAMSYGARLLNIELRGKLRNRDFANNGKIYLSDRDAAAALGTKSTRSIVRWYAENEHYGFLRQTRGGFLGADGRGIAAQYRFTEFAYGPEPPTRDFEKWDGELFRYSPRRSKKQNPVSLGDTPRVPGGHILNSKKQGTVRVPGGHKVETPTRVPGGHTSRIAISPALSGAGDGEQGSSTARAPVQAGDAGSSPAPVARPDPLRGPDGELTTLVLGIVNAQLDELDARRPSSSPPPAPQDVAPPARKPWTTPTITEISIDDLPMELRMMALGLPVPAEKQPEAPPRPAIYGQTNHRRRIYGVQHATG
jgi:hypothetical protein